MKGQSNPEISRSPRNSFRASLGRLPSQVEHRMGAGASPPTNPNRTPNGDGREAGSQNAWAKPRVREGNSPDRPPRPPSPCRVAKDVRLPRQPGCWLRSSHAFKECVTAHWSSGHAPTIHGAQAQHRSGGSESQMVGELSALRRSGPARSRGARGGENAGMSNESRARNPAAVSLRVPGQG